jgi:outer membrane protein
MLLLLVCLAAADTLTIEDAVKLARSRHPAVMQQRAQLAAAQARLTQARALFLPSLTGTLAYQPQTANFAPTPGFKRALSSGSGATLPPPSYDPFNFWQASLGVYWVAWDWGRTAYGARAASQQTESQRLNVDSSLLQVTLDVKLAYYNTVAAAAQVKVSQDAVATQKRHEDQARAFYEVGTRTKIDLASAESDTAAAELTLARAHGALEAAEAALAAALGDEHWRAWTLVTPPEYGEVAPTSLEADIDEALKSRPEPRAFNLLAESYRSSRRAARGQFFPFLTLSLGPNWAGTDFSSLTTNFSATLALTFPLLGMNPMQVHGQMREADANRQFVEAEGASTRNNIRLETAQAHALLTAAREEIVAARKLLTAAHERQQLAEGRYQAGVGSIIELSDAELAFVNAQFQEVQAQLDLASARARLDHALGR